MADVVVLDSCVFTDALTRSGPDVVDAMVKRRASLALTPEVQNEYLKEMHRRGLSAPVSTRETTNRLSREGLLHKTTTVVHSVSLAVFAEKACFVDCALSARAGLVVTTTPGSYDGGRNTLMRNSIGTPTPREYVDGEL